MKRTVMPLSALALLLASCGHGRVDIPKEVLIPIPVPCEIEQIPATELPVPPPGANVAELAAFAAAQIELLKAENIRLRAANTDPCPTEIDL